MRRRRLEEEEFHEALPSASSLPPWFHPRSQELD